MNIDAIIRALPKGATIVSLVIRLPDGRLITRTPTPEGDNGTAHQPEDKRGGLADVGDG